MTRDYIRDPLRRRFSAFVGLPWFEALLDAIYVAYERSDEWGERKIIDGLIESYMLAGHADPGAECSYCDEAKIELRHEDQCNACAEKDEQQKEKERQRENALPPEEQHRRLFDAAYTQRIFMHGLISRDVQ